MSLVTLLLFWKFCHCNIFLSISITRPKITISYLLKPLCVWNSKISSEKDRVMLIHHIYFSHMPMAKFCHIPFCQGKEFGLRPLYVAYILPEIRKCWYTYDLQMIFSFINHQHPKVSTYQEIHPGYGPTLTYPLLHMMEGVTTRCNVLF